MADTNAAVLTTDEVTAMFSYWEVILKCHVSLYKLFQDRVAAWDKKPEMGDIFLEKVSESS